MHIMIDIETLGTKPGSIVATIGAVTFDPASGTLGEEFYSKISITSAQECGLTIDAKTIAWWMEQGSTARAEALSGGESLPASLLSFASWLDDMRQRADDGVLRIWAHGATFDPVLIEAACRACLLPTPWHYTEPRDTRTIYDLAGINLRDFAAVGETHHHALDDARAQARAVCAAYANLNLI